MYPEIKDGDYFEAEHVENGKVEGRISLEGKIAFSAANSVFLCQDQLDGRFSKCKDKKGYVFSYEIGCLDDFSPNRSGFKNFRIIKRADGTEVPNVGEIWGDNVNGYTVKILYVHGEIVHISLSSDYTKHFGIYTLEEFVSKCKRISPEPVEEVVELTIDEIAEKFGKDPSKIRVKKEG